MAKISKEYNELQINTIAPTRQSNQLDILRTGFNVQVQVNKRPVSLIHVWRS